MFPAVLSGGSQRYSHCASGYHVLALYGKTKLFRNQLNDWTVLPPNYTRSHVNHDTNRENKDPQFFSGMQRHKKEELLSGQSRMAMFKAIVGVRPIITMFACSGSCEGEVALCVHKLPQLDGGGPGGDLQAPGLHGRGVAPLARAPQRLHRQADPLPGPE